MVNVGKADPNIMNSNGYSLLHVFSEKGNIDIVKFLIEECKADHNIRNANGITPLYSASFIVVIMILLCT